MMGVAAPVFNYSKREVGANSTSGPTHRIHEKNLENLISPEKKAAAGISGKWGFRVREEERRIA